MRFACYVVVFIHYLFTFTGIYAGDLNSRLDHVPDRKLIVLQHLTMTKRYWVSKTYLSEYHMEIKPLIAE